jgi:hypothetical protein
MCVCVRVFVWGGRGREQGSAMSMRVCGHGDLDRHDFCCGSALEVLFPALPASHVPCFGYLAQISLEEGISEEVPVSEDNLHVLYVSG